MNYDEFLRPTYFANNGCSAHRPSGLRRGRGLGLLRRPCVSFAPPAQLRRISPSRSAARHRARASRPRRARRQNAAGGSAGEPLFRAALGGTVRGQAPAGPHGASLLENRPRRRHRADCTRCCQCRASARRWGLGGEEGRVGERLVPWRAAVGLGERPAHKCGAGGRDVRQIGSVWDACVCFSAASGYAGGSGGGRGGLHLRCRPAV